MQGLLLFVSVAFDRGGVRAEFEIMMAMCDVMDDRQRYIMGLRLDLG